MVFKLEASVMLVNFLLWVKWVLRNAKTFLSFVITLKSAKKSKEWEEPKERGRAGQEDPPGPAGAWQKEAEGKAGSCRRCWPSPYSRPRGTPKAASAGKGGGPEEPRLLQA